MATAPKPAAARPTQRQLMEELAAIVSRHVEDRFTPCIARLADALEDGTSADLLQRRKAAAVLRANSYAYFHLVATAVALALKKELDALLPALKAVRPGSRQELSLVSYDEMDSKLAFSAASRPFEAAHAGELATLNVRLGFALKRDILRLPQNPFRPEVLLAAIYQAWTEFEPDGASHALLAPLLTPALLFDFGPMYAALNAHLQAAARQPGSVEAYNIRKTDYAAARKAAQASGKAALAKQLRALFGEGEDDPPDYGIPLIPVQPSGPAAEGGWRPSTAAPAFRGAVPGQAPDQQPPGVPPARAPLFAFLDGLPQAPAAQAAAPHNVVYLPQLKASLPQGALSRSDENTLDLLSRVFDTVSHDQAIPGEIRSLIGFLQIPVLKAALLDKEFFFQETHPARRLIDLLSRMGWEQRKNPDDPLFQAMQRSVDRVGRDFDQELAVFDHAVGELEALVKAEEERAEQALAGSIAAALKQEKQAVAAKSAREAVAVRINDGELVAVVSTFLGGKWTDVLSLAYGIEDDKPGAVAHATATMDDLVWSVQPKITQDERRKLISSLPALIQRLNQWLDLIRWEDAERLQFFADLAECHAAIVRAPLELSPERQVELAAEAAQRDALRKVAAEQASAQASEDEPDDVQLSLDSVERGAWFSFTNADGTVRQLKLAWVSPRRSLFIFSAGARAEAFSLPVEKLSAALRAGKAAFVAQDGVVARALSEAFAGNDAGPAAA